MHLKSSLANQSTTYAILMHFIEKEGLVGCILVPQKHLEFIDTESDSCFREPYFDRTVSETTPVLDMNRKWSC